jgi:peptidoglycan/LPS O-acetylase OafA/YrhL
MTGARGQVPSTPVNSSRLGALDGLRFFAAMAVVLYHYINRPEAADYGGISVMTQFGYLGVPLFFMISGYVIAVSAAHRSPWAFLVARAVRLYPAYWIGLVFTVVTVAMFNGDIPSVFQLLANITLMNDVVGVKNIDGVYWTLHAELRFYACIFLLILLGVFKYYKIWLTAWLAVTLLHVFTGQPAIVGWFISPVYSPFFIAGILFYLLQRNDYKAYVAAMLPLCLALALWRSYHTAEGFIVDAGAFERGLAVVVVFVFFALFGGLVYRQNRRGLAETIGASSQRLFSAGVNDKQKVSPRFLPLLGSLTYPLYLLHNAAGKCIIDAFTPICGEPIAIVCTIVLMLLLSVFVVLRLEPPLAKGLKGLLQSRFFPALFFSINRRRANVQ